MFIWFCVLGPSFLSAKTCDRRDLVTFWQTGSIEGRNGVWGGQIYNLQEYLTVAIFPKIGLLKHCLPPLQTVPPTRDQAFKLRFDWGHFVLKP